MSLESLSFVADPGLTEIAREAISLYLFQTNPSREPHQVLPPLSRCSQRGSACVSRLGMEPAARRAQGGWADCCLIYRHVCAHVCHLMVTVVGSRGKGRLRLGWA